MRKRPPSLTSLYWQAVFTIGFAYAALWMIPVLIIHFAVWIAAFALVVIALRVVAWALRRRDSW